MKKLDIEIKQVRRSYRAEVWIDDKKRFMTPIHRQWKVTLDHATHWLSQNWRDEMILKGD